MRSMSNTLYTPKFVAYQAKQQKENPGWQKELLQEEQGGCSALQLEIRQANSLKPKHSWTCEHCQRPFVESGDQDNRMMVCAACGGENAGACNPSRELEKFAGPSGDGSDAQKNLERQRAELYTAEEDHDLARIKESRRAQNRHNQVTVWLKAMRYAPPGVLHLTAEMQRKLTYYSRGCCVYWGKMMDGRAETEYKGSDCNEVEAMRQMNDKSGSPIFWFITLVRLVFCDVNNGFVVGSEEVAQMLDMDVLHAYLSLHSGLKVATHEVLGNATRAGGDGAAGARVADKIKLRTVRIDRLGSAWSRCQKTKLLDLLLVHCGMLKMRIDGRGAMPESLLSCKRPDVNPLLLFRNALSAEQRGILLNPVAPIITGLQFKKKKSDASAVVLLSASSRAPSEEPEETSQDTVYTSDDDDDDAQQPTIPDGDVQEDARQRTWYKTQRESMDVDGARTVERKRKRDQREEMEADPGFDSEENPEDEDEQTAGLSDDDASAFDEPATVEIAQSIVQGTEDGKQEMVIEDEDVNEDATGNLSIAVSGPERPIRSAKELDELLGAYREAEITDDEWRSIGQKPMKRTAQTIPDHKIRTATDAEIWQTRDPAANFHRRHLARKANRLGDATKKARREERDAKVKAERAAVEERRVLREQGAQLQEDLQKAAEHERKKVAGGDVVFKKEDGTWGWKRYAPTIHLGGKRGEDALKKVAKAEAKRAALLAEAEASADEVHRIKCCVCGFTRRYERCERQWVDDHTFSCAWLGRKCRESDTQHWERQQRAAAKAARGEPQQGLAGPSSW